MKEIDETIKQYSKEYQKTYALFASKIKDILETILKGANIHPHSITHREKDPESLREKIQRFGKDYDNPLEEITDLAGVRVISYFPKDIDKIAELIKKEFKIDPKNSIDKRQSENPTVFGYASVHLVVSLSNERVKLAEYSIFKNLRCEIQVRTILQHAWAEIEHDIVYKSTEDIPFELRRRFSSLAGMLEIADREFETIRIEEAKVKRRIETDINKEDLNIPIDLISLRYYLEKYHNEKIKRTERIRFLNKFINSKTNLKTINELHQIYTPEILQNADEFIAKSDKPCEKAEVCLIKYFYPIAKKFDVDMNELAEFARCPIFFDENRKIARIKNTLPNSSLPKAGHKRVKKP